MYKSDKRHLNIRNKLFAAIAMLLVSSIMMVSTTYAWFTLSTAPEVQGITTTVGANGALEIALSPMSGDPADITSAVGDSISQNGSWLKTNTTWGNLLNLSDPAYGLNQITLLPALPQLTGGKISETGPLSRPTYGADGRISVLKPDTQFGGKVMEDGELTEGFRVLTGTEAAYGVRAVGTTSGQTPNQMAYNSGLAELRAGMSGAASTASGGLNANGNGLANLLVANALNTAEYYDEYVPAVKSLVASLSASLTQIDNAIKGAMKAGVAANLTGTELEKAVETITNSSIDDLSDYADDVDGLSGVISERNTLAGNINAAVTAANNLPATNVDWTSIYNVVKYLMNTDGNVTVNDKKVSEIKAMMDSPDGLDGDFISAMLKNVDIKLGENSGVYYDIHKLAAKVSAATEVKVNGAPLGMPAVVTLNATINTTYAGTTTLSNVVAAVNELTPKTDATATIAMLDVYYGYVLDFMFRTNAADSWLQLQTEGANRVYESDGSAATMGNGSKITFSTQYHNDKNDDNIVDEGEMVEIDANIVKGLVNGIRLFFFDTASGEVYAVAKATSVSSDPETSTMVGTLELVTFNNEGVVTVGGTKTDDATTTERDESVGICALNQNVEKQISVMVCLDGSSVTNANIMAEGNLAGTLNLQFSSSAELVPMNDADLKSGNVPAIPYSVSFDAGTTGVTSNGAATVNANTAYEFTLANFNSENHNLTVTAGGTVVPVTPDGTGKCTIPADAVTGAISIKITPKTPAPTTDDSTT